MSVQYNGTLVDNIIINDTNISTPRTYYTQGELDSISSAVSNKGVTPNANTPSDIISAIGDIEIGASTAPFFNIFSNTGNLIVMFFTKYGTINGNIWKRIECVEISTTSIYKNQKEFNTAISSSSTINLTNNISLEYSSGGGSYGNSTCYVKLRKSNLKLKSIFSRLYNDSQGGEIFVDSGNFTSGVTIDTSADTSTVDSYIVYHLNNGKVFYTTDRSRYTGYGSNNLGFTLGDCCPTNYFQGLSSIILFDDLN